MTAGRNAWIRAKLGDAVSPSNDKADPKEFPNHPYVGLEHVEAHTMRLLGHGRGADVESTKSTFRKGDVLYGKLRPYLNKVAQPNFDGICSTDFLVFRESKSMDRDYLAQYLNQAWIVNAAAQASRGVQLPRTNWEFLANLLVSFPPDKSEQRAIASLLRNIRERQSGARQHLVTAKRAIDEFRQAVLGAACSGELTAQLRLSREHSSVPDLGRSLSQPNDSDDLDVPVEWQPCLMEELCTKITSGSRDWTPYYGRGAGTFVMAQNVRRGSIDWTYRQAVDPPLTDSARGRSQIRIGDLLVTIVGANTGDVGPVKEDRPQHYVCQSVALMRPRNIAVTPFLNLWFSSLRHGRKYLMECAYGAGRPHLSFAHLRNTPIALPSQEEQDEIVRRVAELEALAHDVLARIDKAALSLDDCASATIETALNGRATELLPVAASQSD